LCGIHSGWNMKRSIWQKVSINETMRIAILSLCVSHCCQQSEISMLQPVLQSWPTPWPPQITLLMVWIFSETDLMYNIGSIDGLSVENVNRRWESFTSNISHICCIWRSSLQCRATMEDYTMCIGKMDCMVVMSK
jgi:hypothetical protein